MNKLTPIDEIFIALHPEIQFDSDLIKSFDPEIEQTFHEFQKLCESTPEIWEAYQKYAEVFESQENVKFDFAYKDGFRYGVKTGLDVAGCFKIL